MTPQTYHIFYGFFGGQAHGREMRHLLHAAGLRKATSAQAADIIIAHSAGCWRVTDDLRPKLTLFIGMPLQPGKAYETFRTAVRGNKADHATNPRRGKKIQSLNMLYMALQPRRSLHIIRKGSSYMEQPIKTNPQTNQTVFIKNADDPWPNSPLLDKALESLPYSFISLPGSHVNIWHRPERYVAIIKHYATLLATTN
jgi:hypothetical protein